MNDLIFTLSSFSGKLLIALIAFCGAMLGSRLKGVQHGIFTSLKSIFAEKAGKGKLGALLVSLGGTIGAGNIIGVAGAVRLGGRGAVLWLVVGAFFGMTIKFAEVALAVKYKKNTPDGDCGGGAMYVAESTCASGGKSIRGKIFCVCCMGCALVMGNVTQSAAIVKAAGAEGVFAFFCAGVLCAALFLLSDGKQNRIFALSSVLVPAMGLLYIGASLAVIFANCGKIPAVSVQVFKGAFLPDGTNPVGFLVPMAYGFSRGLLSNEAGLGSSPIAHAGVRGASMKSAYMGVVEVFFSTVFVGILTCFSVMLTDADLDLRLDFGNMVSAAFGKVLGKSGELVVRLSTVLFAFTSVASWFLYASVSANYLWGKDSVRRGIFTGLFCFAPLLGAVVPPETATALSDVFCFMMCASNLAIVMPCAMTENFTELMRYEKAGDERGGIVIRQKTL